MTKTQLYKISENSAWERDIATRIMNGDHDGYDGADGARTVLQLCRSISALITAIEDSGIASND